MKFLKIFFITYVTLFIVLVVATLILANVRISEWSYNFATIPVLFGVVPIISILISGLYQDIVVLKIISSILLIIVVVILMIPRSMGSFGWGSGNYSQKCFGIKASKTTTSDSWDNRCYGIIYQTFLGNKGAESVVNF
jgi:hypothetical protein